MRFTSAITTADNKSTATGEEYFVICTDESDPKIYDVASQYDLDTFYSGIDQRSIVFSTVEGVYSTSDIS